MAIIPPVDVPVIRSKWSVMRISKSCSRNASTAAEKRAGESRYHQGQGFGSRLPILELGPPPSNAPFHCGWSIATGRRWSQHSDYHYGVDNSVCNEPIEVFGAQQSVAHVVADVQASLVAKQRSQIDLHILRQCPDSYGVTKHFIQVLEKESAVPVGTNQGLATFHEHLPQCILYLWNCHMNRG